MFNTLHSNTVDVPFSWTHHIIQMPHKIDHGVPFPFLTPEATSILHRLVENDYAHHKRSNERTSCFLRGLGYESSFIRNTCYHPDVLQYLRYKTDLPGLQPHYLFSNIGHINIGIPNERDVDHWHYDSVTYVLIIMISDPSSFQGGILEYMDKNDHIIPIHFPHAGYAIFMKGSEWKHHVTAVKSGMRMTMIHSYIDQDDPIDHTRLETFEADPDFLEEKEWRKRFYPS